MSLRATALPVGILIALLAGCASTPLREVSWIAVESSKKNVPNGGVGTGVSAVEKLMNGVAVCDDVA